MPSVRLGAGSSSGLDGRGPYKGKDLGTTWSFGSVVNACVIHGALEQGNDQLGGAREEHENHRDIRVVKSANQLNGKKFGAGEIP